MGTNYYLHNPPCECCGKSDEPLHIGKSSVGWHFAVHVMPDNGISSLKDWIERFSAPGVVIRDEYHQVLSPAEMVKVITERAGSGRIKDFDFEGNHAKPGLNGLVACKVDGKRCLANGKGPYDYITGEFF